MTNKYAIRKLENRKPLTVEVPGSKSITNRALLLAALSHCRCRLRGILFSDDSRAFLECLVKLGFEVMQNEEIKEVVIQGMGGRIPNRRACLNVRSAGTAARFLTVMLAFAGGEYELDASPQMCRRPMQPLLDILEGAGAVFVYKGQEGHFPFSMKADSLSLEEVLVDTGVSSQFASALLMAGGLLRDGLRVEMAGSRAEGSYIKMTIAMMRQFGVEVRKEQCLSRSADCPRGRGERWAVPHSEGAGQTWGLEEYQVEPDVSGACYFYALAPLLGTEVTVRNVHENSLQGDIRFLEVLRQMGCKLEERPEGICVSGRGTGAYPGIELSMKDFSDQTMTMAVLAPFAKGPTLIRDIGHIRFQESDRISAILTELTRLGIRCEEAPEADGIRIWPGRVQEAEVETYEDHRMAMAFTLIGLRTGKVTILNPMCCRKTFENYFDLIEELY